MLTPISSLAPYTADMLQTPTKNESATGKHSASESAAFTPTALFLIAISVYGLSGIFRTLDTLTSFDIANATLLALLARHIAWRTPAGYACIFGASALVNFVFGQMWQAALLHATADTLGIAAGVAILAQCTPAVLQMEREQSALQVLWSSLVSSATNTAIMLPWLWQAGQADLPIQVSQWISTEFMNYVLVVPLILSYRTHHQWQINNWKMLLPMLSLLLSEIMATIISGPGAIAFTLPAFLWCALRYPLFVTAFLFTVFSVWKCHVLGVTGTELEASSYLSPVVSLRLGLSLLWLGPLTVACSHASRSEVLKRLQYASQHDHLTRTLVRSTFLEYSEKALSKLRTQSTPLALLMLDIDHFKQVNDQHGHATGDAVLQGFARTIGSMLRESDYMGRYGGEEFCICLPNIQVEDACAVADRLRSAVLAQPFTTSKGEVLHVTVSMGLAHFAANALPQTITEGLIEADKLLYNAKTGGRNRVESRAFTTPPIAILAETASQGSAETA